MTPRKTTNLEELRSELIDEPKFQNEEVYATPTTYRTDEVVLNFSDWKLHLNSDGTWSLEKNED
jgi:hypothetical protein